MSQIEAKKAAQNMTMQERLYLISENMDTLMEAAKTVGFNKIDPKRYDKLSEGMKQAGINEQLINDNLTIVNKIDEVLLSKYDAEGEATKLINNRNLKLNFENALEKVENDVKEKQNEKFKQGFKDNTQVKFQQSDVAGVEKTSDIEVAKKEWKEKGTDSKYFKKWFGDSKVVDEDGKPLVVYHGTEYDFDEFEANNASTDYDFPSGMYFSSSRNIAKTYTSPKPDIVMPLYLKIENPLVLDANGRNYNDFYDELYSVVRGMDKDVYDGIIINNIRDNWSQNDDGGEVATTYVTFNPEQIKSVDNQGTFDESNPNIYYQDNNISLNFKSFEELQETFKNDIEETPEDYKINNLEDALKDLGITENKPKEVKTPYETIQVRARNIEHIINSEGDKSRYKSINRMFATLERPNIITIDEQGKRAYFKIFVGNNKTKRQITYVSTDEQGNFVLTTIPVKRNKKFINAINKGNIIYESRKGVINNSPDNNIITDNSRNFNPKTVHLYNISEKKKGNILFQSGYHGGAKDFDRFDLSYALSGEGAMAHGYGVYVAKNKEVSEEYREKLTNGYSSTQYEYKNKKNDYLV